jgi:hypothetical protein
MYIYIWQYYIILYYNILYIILYYIKLYYVVLYYMYIWNIYRSETDNESLLQARTQSAWTWSGLSSRLSWRTLQSGEMGSRYAWHQPIDLHVQRSSYTDPFFGFSYLVGKETLIIWFQRVLSQSQCGWLPHWTNISQLGQEEGMLSPEGKKIPTRGIGASRIKQQQAATHAMCMCIFCQNPS